MTTLSVIIITKNEAHNIINCLESVRFANEIIVLDSGSTDGTQALCRKYTQQVFDVDWLGYGVQKNKALELAKCKWVLAIDADEYLSHELQEEIQNKIAFDTPYVAYSIRRRSKYCGKLLRHGDWKNDHCIRLFLRGKAKFKEVPVHENLIVKEGKTGNLKNDLLHHSYPDLEHVLGKMNTYSTLSASHYLNQNKTSSFSKAILHGLWTFIRSYFIRLGFLDGREGFMLAFSNAEGCYYRYLKMLYLKRDNSD